MYAKIYKLHEFDIKIFQYKHTLLHIYQSSKNLYKLMQCKKCNKIFERQEHLIRHNNRLTSCYKDLSCDRCGKNFNMLGDLKRHLNRKIPCDNNKYIKELEYKIEYEKTKQEQEKTKQEELKIKQIMLSKKQTECRDIINNIENQYNNQITINNYNHEYNKDKNIVSNMIVSDDLVQTIQNFFKNQYNNMEYKENQCIQIKDNKIFAYLKTSTGFKELGYAELKPHIKNHIRSQVNDIIQEHEEITEENMIIYKIPQRNFIASDKIETVKKIPLYVNNERNNAIVKTQLIMALK
jgi:uncharacterized C2H2 Zn-finger protein